MYKKLPNQHMNKKIKKTKNKEKTQLQNNIEEMIRNIENRNRSERIKAGIRNKKNKKIILYVRKSKI
jgi:hypothetical protein